MNILNFSMQTMKEEEIWGFIVGVYPLVSRHEMLQYIPQSDIADVEKTRIKLFQAFYRLTLNCLE